MHDSIVVETSAGDVQDNVVVGISPSGEEEGGANSSFSEATDEDGEMEKELEEDTLNEESDDEMMGD